MTASERRREGSVLEQQPRRIPGIPLLILLGVVVLVSLGGWLVAHRETESARREAERQLSAVADLKVSQIVEWRAERMADAAVISRNPFNATRVKAFLSRNDPRDRGDDIRAWMDSIRHENSVLDVLLVDSGGSVRLTAGPSPADIGRHARGQLADVVRTGKTVLSDLHVAAGIAVPHLDLCIPLSGSASGAGGKDPFGAMLVRIDPNAFLFPLVKLWPVPSPTAETLLVRRDGDSVTFLNELRHRKGTILSLTFPLASERLPAAMAARGAGGVVRGIDYRGIPVLAAPRAIPDSPWFLVAKVDEEEVFSALRRRVGEIAAAAAGLILFSALGLLLWWKQKEAGVLRRQIEVEEALRKSEERHRLFLENARDVVLLLRCDGRIAEANEAAQRAYGHDREALLSMTIRDLRAPVTRQDLSGQMEEADRRGILFETEHLRRDGTTFPVEVSSRGVTVGDERFLMSVVRDITDRKRAEQEVRVLEAQLSQAQKMESIGRLAGGVAHDFNNLLLVILGHAELLLSKVAAADPALRASLQEIRTAGERARDLTAQLLAFGRRQMLEIRTIDLNEVVADFEKMLSRLIGEGIAVSTDLDPGAGPVRADPSQVVQILMNLSVNARDAMRDGGTLVLATANADLVGESAKGFPEASPGQYVMLSVSDTGCGMDAETRERIFDPFFTTKETGKGTGLGLSTVYGIVRQHGGHITVESAPGKGSDFRIYLPRADGRDPDRAGTGFGGISAGGSERILVVEDDPVVRDLVCRLLAALGYDVIEAAGVDDALRVAQERDGIRLVLTDVVMPGMSGRQLFERIAVLRPGIGVLYMSGYDDDEISGRGVVAAGVPFLQKPFTAEALARKVREALSG